MSRNARETFLGMYVYIYCLGVGGGGLFRQRASVKFLKSVEMGRGRGCARV